MRTGEHRLRGIGHATGTVDTSADAITIPTKATALRITVASACLAAVGDSGTPPVLSTANAASFAANGTELWYIAQGRGVDTHLYLQAEAANAAAIALYEGCGFRVAGRYFVRTKG